MSYISTKLLRHRSGKLILVRTEFEINPYEKTKKSNVQSLEPIGEQVFIEENPELQYLILHITQPNIKNQAVEVIKTQLALSEEETDKKDNTVVLKIPLSKVSFGFVPSASPKQVLTKPSNDEKELTDVTQLSFKDITALADHFLITLLNINKDKNIVEIRIYNPNQENKAIFLNWGKVCISNNVTERIATHVGVKARLQAYAQKIKENSLTKKRRETLKNELQTEVGTRHYFCFNKLSLYTFYSLTKKILSQDSSFYLGVVNRLQVSLQRLDKKAYISEMIGNRDVIFIMENDEDNVNK
jgi:hypothetical protein